MRTALASAALLIAAAAPASADEFDRRASSAQRLRTPAAVAALFWSQDASCGRIDNDFQRRQCDAVRRARADEVRGETYLVEAGSGALDVSAYDAKRKSVRVGVRGCVACSEDDEVYVVGGGRHKVVAGALEAPALRQAARSFETEDDATHWTTYVAPRLRTELLVKVPARGGSFRAAGKEGYRVEVVGYRVSDPCTGDVLVAKPASESAPVDVSTCAGEPERKPAAEPEPAPEVEEPKGPALPERLTTSQINRGLEGARERAAACHEAYGIDGTASFRLTIAGDGSVAAVEQSGDFVGTPTGTCVEAAVRASAFPASKKKQTTVTYPIVLQ